MAENEPLISVGDPDTSPGNEYEDFPQELETHLPIKTQKPVLQRIKTGIDAVRDHLSAWRNVYLCGWLIVALELPMFMSAAPGIQLIEDAMCRKIYGRDFARDMCQGKDVQTKIAEVRGVLAVLSAIPSMEARSIHGTVC